MKTKFLTILLLAASVVMGFRLYPSGVLIETTVEHELIFEKDTVMVIHWHKSGDKFYIITADSMELWVDNVLQLKSGVLK